MPLNDWQNWHSTPTRPAMARGTPATGGGGPLPPGLTNGSDGFTRQVQSNELASTHMEELGRNDNRVLQQARQRGVQAGASRGGINSNLAAAGGEAAWLDAAGNVAMQQAGAYGTAAGQNLDSLSRQRMSAEGNATSIQTADISAGASIYGSDRNLEAQRERLAQDREMTLSDRDYRADQSRQEREYQTGRDETQNRYNRENADIRFGYDQDAEDRRFQREAAGQIFQRMLDSPEEWDEWDASGASEFFNNILRPTFPPRNP